jgi:hypothetical protein
VSCSIIASIVSWPGNRPSVETVRTRFGNASAELAGKRVRRLREPTYLVDQLTAGAHQPVARAQQHEVPLRLLSPVHDRCEQVGVDAAETREKLGIEVVTLRVVLGDQPHPPRVGDDRVVSEPGDEPAHPGRVRADFQNHPRRLEASQARSSAGAVVPTGRLDDSPPGVEYARFHRLVGQIQPDRQPARRRDMLTHASLLLGPER